jgi:hypothetical protein
MVASPEASLTLGRVHRLNGGIVVKSMISLLVLLLAATCVQKVQAKGGADEQREQPGPQQTTKAPVTRNQAIAIASKDAEGFSGDLTLYEIHVKEAKRVWHIDFELKKKGANGGPLHYRISKATGKIVWKQYEQ